MNRRDFLKWTGVAAAASVVPAVAATAAKKPKRYHAMVLAQSCMPAKRGEIVVVSDDSGRVMGAINLTRQRLIIGDKVIIELLSLDPIEVGIVSKGWRQRCG